jgi:hypothetical protein
MATLAAILTTVVEWTNNWREEKERERKRDKTKVNWIWERERERERKVADRYTINNRDE